QADFDKAADEVEELNQQLTMLVAGFDDALSDEEKLKAIDAFKARHAEKYEAFETKGEALAELLPLAEEYLTTYTLPFGARKESWREVAESVLKELDRVGETEA